MVGWVEYQRRRLAAEEKNIPWFVGNKLKAYDFARGLGVKVPEVYKSFMAPAEFDASGVPDWFVCKPLGMHSTQGVMILRRTGPGEYFDHLRQRNITDAQIIKEQTDWYEKNEYKGDYRLVLEEKLVGEDNNPYLIPFDYKVYCFGDRVELVTQIDRNHNPPTMCWFIREFEPILADAYFTSDWKIVRPGTPVLPACYKEIIASAKAVSVGLKTPFASVDMYATPRGAVLGEITLSPGGPYHGFHYKFLPYYDEYLGRRWAEAVERLMVDIN